MEKENDKKEISSLIDLIRTTDERDLLHERVETVERSLYRVGGPSLGELLRRIMPERFVEALEGILKNVEGSVFTSRSREALSRLRGILGGLEVVRLELAFDPSEAAIERWSDWFKGEVGKEVILDLRLDHSLLGGARISFRGRYFEMSLKKMVERALEKEDHSRLKKSHEF